MSGLSASQVITEQSPPPVDPDLLAYGPLVLNLQTRVLTGPDGWAIVCPSERAVLQLLMQPRLVTAAELIRAAFPRGTRQPRRPLHALAMRLARLRTTLDQVGVSAVNLRNHAGEGWTLGVGSDETRTFAGVQLRVLNRLLETHPDREGVALLG